MLRKEDPALLTLLQHHMHMLDVKDAPVGSKIDVSLAGSTISVYALLMPPSWTPCFAEDFIGNHPFPSAMRGILARQPIDMSDADLLRFIVNRILGMPPIYLGRGLHEILSCSMQEATEYEPGSEALLSMLSSQVRKVLDQCVSLKLTTVGSTVGQRPPHLLGLPLSHRDCTSGELPVVSRQSLRLL